MMEKYEKNEDTYGDSWKCPFYKKIVRDKETYRLTCEGCLVRMPNKESMQKITDQFCNASYNYKKCPIYKVLDEYYDERYGGGKK